MTTTAESPTGTARLHGLDALRAGALGLGIVIHTLMPFLPGNAWLFGDMHRSIAAGVVIIWIHLFRMVLFMALAGYFGRMVLHRRGAGAYLRDRSKRILLPLLVFAPLVLASFVAVEELNTALRGAPDVLSSGSTPGLLALLNPGHLWFLGILMESIVLTVLARAALRRLFGGERLTALAHRAGGALAAPAGVLLAALPYAAGLLLQGTPSDGINEPATIVPTVPALTAYLGAFLVGWCLHARPDALGRLARQWPLQLGIGVVFAVAAYVVLPSSPVPVQAVLVAVSGWGWAFGFIGLATRFLNRENRTIRYLADSSYWVYILHLPIVAIIQVFLVDLDWPIVVKLAVTWAISGILLLLSYDLLVRSTWIGRWLNGRRRPAVLLPGRAVTAVTAAAESR